jgi:putative membrane protein
LKIAIFFTIVVVAIAPTVQYIRWNREARSAPTFTPLERDVERARASIALGLGLWLILPLIAILVARGYG